MGLSILQKIHTERHRLFYIFIWEGQPPDEFQHFLSVIFWKHNILNALTIYQSTTETDHHMITYNPFTRHYIEMPNDVYKRNELFIEKDLDLHGYPMYMMSLIRFYRFTSESKSQFSHDSFLPSVITNVMNATLNINRVFLKDLNLKQVVNVDLLLNSGSYETSLYKVIGIEPTISIRRDDICILVPFKRFRPMVESIYRTLNPYVWICAIVVAVPVTIALILISKMKGHRSWSNSVLLCVFGYYFDLPSPNLPKEVAPRWILAGWLLHCVIIATVFQSALYQGITFEGREPPLTNITNVLSSGYKILINEVFYDSTIDFINNSSLKDNFKVVSVLEYMNYLQSNNKSYAYVERLRRTTYFARIQTEDDLPVYYTMNIVPQYYTYYVRLGSPFLNRINRIIRQSEENGLFQYWENRLTPSTPVKRQKLFHRPKSGYLENLFFIFEYWFYALCICFLVFVLEFFVKKLETTLKFKNLIENKKQCLT